MSHEGKGPLKVFLCHASGDKQPVRELYKHLVAEGVDAWLDQEKLLPGQDWRLEIPRAVQDADVVVVCLSNKSVTKEGYVQKEIKFALDIAEEKPEGAIFLIPARLEDCVVPERLSRWQWVDLYEEKGFTRLLRSLKLRAIAVGAIIEPAPDEDTEMELDRRLDQLYTEGLAAFYTEDWDKSCRRFQAILSEQPSHRRATEKLEEAQCQRQFARLYVQATEAYRSKNWHVAISALDALTQKAPAYKDAAQLLRDARKRAQLTELYAEAQALHAAQKWQAVVKVFEQISVIEPNYPDVDGLLVSAQKEVAEIERLAALNDQYSHALREMDSGKWYESRRLLEGVHKSQTGFLETEKLLRKVENEISKEEEKRKQNDQINTLYEQAHGLLRSKKWRNVLDKLEEIRKLDEHFPDTDGIVEEVQKELEREEQEAERQNKLAALYAEAVRLLKEEKYQEALDKWGEVRSVDPKYPDRQWVGRTAKKELAKQTKPVSAKARFAVPRSLWIGLGGIAVIAIVIFAIIKFGNDKNNSSFTPTVVPATVAEEKVVPIPTTDLEERIVFSSGGDGSGDQIFLMSPDGGDVTQLTFDPGQVRRRPSISPNGDKIAFSSGQWGNMNIYLVNPDGSDLTNLTNLPGDENEPKWSPDGKTIVFSSTRDGNSEIYSINVNRTGLTRLTKNPAEDVTPYWNPDGKTIVFSSDRDADFDIYTMKPDGSELKRLTINNSNDTRPSWSPDGDYIAFTSERDGNNEIYIMKSDGSEQTNISDDPGNDYYPNWSPDGKHIVFFSDRDGDGSIWIYSMDLSSNLTARLTSGGSPFWGVVLKDAIEKTPVAHADNLGSSTSVPSPTTLPGKLFLPIESFGKTIPWLPQDESAIPVVHVVSFNTIHSPFDNPLVRQAFVYAIDRQQIVEMAKKYKVNNPRLATTLTPPETLGRDLSGEVGIGFDPQKAKELLSEAGYSNPSDFPVVTFLVSAAGEVAPGARFNMASAMADMWKTHLGVTVQVEAMKWSDYFNRLKSDPPDLYWLGWQGENDPNSFLREIYHSGAEGNFGNFSNPEFDQLVDLAADSNDPAKRQELYIRAERLLCETESAVIPLYHATSP